MNVDYPLLIIVAMESLEMYLIPEINSISTTKPVQLTHDAKIEILLLTINQFIFIYDFSY